MAVCLVTGGAGFLGSHLVEALLADHHVVRVLDNFTTGSLHHLARVMHAVELYPGDCGEPAFLANAIRGAELVFHMSDEGLRGGTGRLLYTAAKSGVRRLLFASSMRVQGGPAHSPIAETDPAEPDTPHGRAKLAGENTCLLCARASGLETVCLRYFNVFGPRQPAASPYAAVVRDALTAMRAGRIPSLGGEGRSRHDLIYISDAVHATLLAARAPRVAGRVYNIAAGRPITSLEVVETLNELLGTSVEAVYTGSAPCALNNVADVRRAEVELGFCAAVDLRQGLRRCLEGEPGPLRVDGPGQRPHMKTVAALARQS